MYNDYSNKNMMCKDTIDGQKIGSNKNFVKICHYQDVVLFFQRQCWK